MALTKKDKSEVKNIARGEIRGIVKQEISDAISEVIIPAFDQVYKAIGDTHHGLNGLKEELKDFKVDTERNFADVKRQINDLKLDTPSNRKFLAHEERIHKLEYELGFV